MAGLDQHLERRAIAGDRDALGRLLHHHGSEVRKSLAGAIPHRFQSVLSLDDVMQQTYVDAFLDVARFVPAGDGSFPAWLTQLAHRNLQDALRLLSAAKRGGDRCRVAAGDPDASRTALIEDLCRTSTTASRVAILHEHLAALDRAVEDLPEPQRSVVRMYDLHGLPVEEIASALNRSPGAVFMLRARAHRRLREAMAADQSTQGLVAT